MPYRLSVLAEQDLERQHAVLDVRVYDRLHPCVTAHPPLATWSVMLDAALAGDVKTRSLDHRIEALPITLVVGHPSPHR